MWQRLRRVVPAHRQVQLRRAGQIMYSVRLQADDSLLLSYPKSGSSWVRNMLAVTIAGHEIPPSDLARWVPPLHLVSSRDPAVNVLRSHDPVHTPGFGRAGRIVVLARDPRALAVSWAFHQQQRGAVGYSVDDAATELVGHGYLALGSWQSHMRAAIDHADQGRVTIVRYEDVVADPSDALGLLCEQLRIDTTAEVIDLAVACNTPDALRERLVKSGVEAEDQPISLVRNAVAESWRTECSDAVSERIVAAAASEMIAAGFRP